MTRTLNVVAALGLLLMPLWLAPVGAEPSLAMQADAAYQAKDWPQAAALYRKLADANVKDAASWFRLGLTLVRQGKAADAIAIFEKRDAHGLSKPMAELGLALAYAASDREQALTHLQAAAANGFNDSKRVEAEELFASLKSDARFAKIMNQIHKNETPCAFEAQNRAFDFWVGDWNVVQTGTDGPQVGTSKIEQILNQCVILENWSSARSPYAGKSFNIYNTDFKRWEQYWVDNVGGTIFFHGNLQNGVMDYGTDDIRQPDGKMLRRHLQFFKLNGDTVRQFSQGSNDGGKTWFVEYDFTYHRSVAHSD